MRAAQAALSTSRSGRKRRRPTDPLGHDPCGGFAGSEFRQWLLLRYAKGELSAKDVCTAAWALFNKNADTDDLALAPNSRSGHFERHLTKALQLDNFAARDIYFADIPFHDKAGNRRQHREHGFLLPHERVAAIAADDLTAFAPPAEERDAIGQLPRYQGCSLLQDLGWERVACLGFYVDAAPHSKRDSFYAFYWNNVFSIERRVITTIRKSDLCRCGCRGLCSINAIMKVIVWSFLVLRSGFWPVVRHDNRELDPERKARQGPLPMHGVLVELRADWKEFSETFGFKSWASAEYPCFKCCADRDQCHEYTKPLPRQRGDQDYRTAASWSQTVLLVNEVDAPVLQKHLFFDTRDKGNRGRCVLAAVQIGLCRLQAGDRVESIICDGQRIDTHADLTSLPSYPARLTMFRRGESSWLSSVSPIFQVVDFNNIAIDVLHCIDLGVVQYCVGWVFVVLLLADVFRTGAQSDELLLVRGVSALKAELCRWYRMNPLVTKVTNLTVGMVLGTAGNIYRPVLRAKGAESRGLFVFAIHLMRCFAAGLGSIQVTHLHAACEALIGFSSWWRVAVGVCRSANVMRLSRPC